MLTLDLAGALSRYRTFPRPLDLGAIRSMHFVSRSEKKFYFDLVALARDAKRDDVVWNLRWARFKSRFAAFVRDRVLRRRRPVKRSYQPSRW
jgi:hypothetical protein